MCCLQNCIAQTEVFHASKGGAEQAKEMQVPFLGRVPLDPLLSRAAEEGRSAFDQGSQKGRSESDQGSSEKGRNKQFIPSLSAMALQAIIQQLLHLTEGGATKRSDHKQRASCSEWRLGYWHK